MNKMVELMKKIFFLDKRELAKPNEDNFNSNQLLGNQVNPYSIIRRPIRDQIEKASQIRSHAEYVEFFKANELKKLPFLEAISFLSYDRKLNDSLILNGRRSFFNVLYPNNNKGLINCELCIYSLFFLFCFGLLLWVLL